MALLWVEGFEGFGSSIGSAPAPTDIMARKYPNVGLESFMDIETGRGGTGYCLEFNNASCSFQSPDLTTDSTMVVGFAFQRTEAGGTGDLLIYYDGTTKGTFLNLNSNGTLSVKRSSTVLGTTINAIAINTWYYVEFKVKCSNTVGTVDIYVNGSNWLTLSSQDTKQGVNDYHTSFLFSGFADDYKIDDLYCLDTTGPDNNDVLGPRKVVAIDPDGIGDNSDWTPSAGSNYQNVDDGALLDEDTTYNETSTDAQQDLFTYENLPATVVTVDGLQITTDARITAGNMDLSTVVKTGTTTDVGSPTNIISTDYVTTVRIDEVDPDTAIAWIPSGVDGAQFGVLANT